MLNAQALFQKNINDTNSLTAIYDYMCSQISLPLQVEDLLRSKVVYSVSAFDKLMHDLIRIGMTEIYMRRRKPTKKYLQEPISLSVMQQLVSESIPPPEILFEQTIQTKLKTLSFQNPDKVADGLSYIWDEPNKWQKISVGLAIPEPTLKTTLRLIADRRNTIVHEADIDPTTGLKITITKLESDSISSFLLKLGNEICKQTI